MTWISSLVIRAILSWLLDIILGVAEGVVKMMQIERRNEEIKERVDKAETPEEIQDALNEAASHLGRSDRP